MDSPQPEAPVRRRFLPLPWHLYLAGLVGGALALKVYIVSHLLPRIWLFLDEMFYLVAAYDLGHWGKTGVPHPDFLYYPPLTSALLAPLLAIGFEAPVVYHAGLLLFHVLLASAVIAGCLLLRRLFDRESWLLPAALILGPPAYMAFLLMSEPLFVTLFTWFLYVWVRMLQDRRARDAWIAGLLLAGLVLTRFTGYMAVASFALAGAADFWLTRDRRRLGLTLRVLLVPAAVTFLWHFLSASIKTESSESPAALLAVVLSTPMHAVLGTIRRFFAEIGYVSLSTFGFVLPAALWVFRRSAFLDDDDRARELRLFLFYLFSFLALACGLAGAFMWYGHFLSDLPRFDVYGRYVEYFAIPLLAVAFGVFAALRERTATQDRITLTLGAYLLNAVFLLFIPETFFTASLNGQVTPNSLGIAWLIRAVGWLGLWSRWLAPVLAALLVWGLTSRGAVRRIAGAALLVLVGFNFFLGLRETSINSVGSAVYGSAISHFVLEHRETFANGLYVEYPDYLHPEQFPVQELPLVLRVISDHVGLVIAGRDVESYAGKMPVLTRKKLDRPILAEWPSVEYRIYAADPPAP